MEKFIHFTKQIEYTDHVSLFLEKTEDVGGYLKRLLWKPEKYFKMMTGRNLNDDLKVWHELMTNQLKKEELRYLKHESEQLYIKLWDKRFSDTKEQ